jgi:hypothetical protein
VELLLDPSIRVPAATLGWKLAKKALGFRTLLDVIPLDASLVKGSHGRPDFDGDEVPLVITSHRDLVSSPTINSVDVYSLILKHLRAYHAG